MFWINWRTGSRESMLKLDCAFSYQQLPHRDLTSLCHTYHRVRQAEDPLANAKIPCFGDQLTRVRLAGAKDLRAGSQTPKDRLDYIDPFREELPKVRYFSNQFFFSTNLVPRVSPLPIP